jgi:putative phage-type endonuclease
MAKPILLCDTAGMTRERWLECRMHGADGKLPYTVGGSDVAVVMGVSPWNTPLELWRIKKDLMKPDDTANATAKEMGHLMEPVVAHCYGVKTGNTVVADTGLYQHAKYPYALANLDYRLEEDGKSGVLECKTTTWHNTDHWADGQIPYHYELQVRFYLAVMDLEFADITCMWGFSPENDMAIRRIHRDLAIEEHIFECLDAFIDSLHRNIPPTMTDVKPSVAMSSLARIYGDSKKGLPEIEFSKKQEKRLRQIAALQGQNEDLQTQIKKNEGDITALGVQIAELMKDHEHGILTTSADRLIVDFVTKFTRRPDSKQLKDKYPAVYDEVLKASSSRKLKVTVQPV